MAEGKTHEGQLITNCPVALIAMAKALREDDIDEARDALSEGKYRVSASLRLLGTMSIGKDYDSEIVAKARPWDLLAIALSKLNNITIDSLVAEAEALMDESMHERVTEIKRKADKAIQKIKAATRTTVRGRITPQISVEVFNDLSAKAA